MLTYLGIEPKLSITHDTYLALYLSFLLNHFTLTLNASWLFVVNIMAIMAMADSMPILGPKNHCDSNSSSGNGAISS